MTLEETGAPDPGLYSNVLGSDLSLFIVYPDTNFYEVIKPQFDTSGHAFLLHAHKMIVVDGSLISEEWFTKEHMLVIAAHELAHYRAEHAVCDADDPADVEREADWLGSMILKEHGLINAHDLHNEEYQNRYGSTVQADDELFRIKLGKLIF